MPKYIYIWVPWESGYKEHLDRFDISHDQFSAIREQTAQFKDALLNQTSQISDQTKEAEDGVRPSIRRYLKGPSRVGERGWARLAIRAILSLRPFRIDQ